MFGLLKEKFNNVIQDIQGLSLQQQYRNRKATTRAKQTEADYNDDLQIKNNWSTAGIALLDKYEKDWKEISENNEQNAMCADAVAIKIDKIEKRMQKQRSIVTNLNIGLLGLSDVRDTLKSTEKALQQVQALTEIVEGKFKRLLDLCEECDLQEFMLQKQCQLSAYKQKKMVDLEAFRKTIAMQHEMSIRAHEEKLKNIQKERQQIFDECFQEDLAEYRQHGTLKRIEGTKVAYNVPLESVSLDNIEPEDALEKFLNG